MKFYSEVLKKVFDTEEACVKAEKEAVDAKKAAEEARMKKDEERKARAKEVELAFNDLKAAQQKYNDLLAAFLKDYKVYHYSGSSLKDFPSLFGLWDALDLL